MYIHLFVDFGVDTVALSDLQGVAKREGVLIEMVQKELYSKISLYFKI